MIIRTLGNGLYAGRLSGQNSELVCFSRLRLIELLLKLKEFQLK